jgi:chemotaxis protein CheD
MNAIMKPPTIVEGGAFANDLAMKDVYLHPGQMYVSKEPVQISMILGSCAGVCMYDRGQSIGGATHYILPKWDGSGQRTPRYGDVAIEVLLEEMRALGSASGYLEARVFGGACMFQALRGPGGTEDHIGSRNIEAAMQTLARFQIAVVARDTGGENGRKLKMRSDTGEVTVSVIRNS